MGCTRSDPSLMKRRALFHLAATGSLGMLASCETFGSNGMTLTSDSFGQTKDGKNVTRYTLRNAKGMEVQVINYGCIITSIKVPGKNGGPATDVALGFDKLSDYETRNPFFGAIAGRYANRIGHARFTLDGKEYHLAANDGPNTLHGGKAGFDKKVWKASTIHRGGNAGVEFSYTSPDGEEGYPGTVQCRVTYVLTAENEIEIEYHATTDKPTVLNLTNHSYFNLAGEGSGSILDQVVTIHADAFTPTDNGLIPTGETASVHGTPLDFTTPQRIGARIDSGFLSLKQGLGYDQNFILNGGSGLKLAARAQDPKSGRVLEVRTTEPAVQFYSGNHMKTMKDCKNGHTYAFRGGFCFETQHYPDSPNQPAFPTTVLRPGDVYQHTCVYKLWTE